MADAAKPSLEGKGLGLLCPACRVDLVMSERQGIEIDYCPKCRGVWLDRGELDKIVERSVSEEGRGAKAQSSALQRQSDPSDGEYEGGHGSGHGGRGSGRGRRRSFLGDLFD